MSEEDTTVVFVVVAAPFWLRRHKIIMKIGGKNSVLLMRSWSWKKAVDKANWWNAVAQAAGVAP